MNINLFFFFCLSIFGLFNAQEKPKECAEYKEKCVRSSDCCHYMKCATLNGVGPMCIYLN